MELMKASEQWAVRPMDERFLDLPSMLRMSLANRQRSKALAVSSHQLIARPVEDNSRGLVVTGPSGQAASFTNWSFGQLCAKAGVPAGFARELPSDLAADVINNRLQAHDVADLGILLGRNETTADVSLRAVTGPNYGRVWNHTVIKALVERFGDGRTGDFRVPGEFGQDVPITKDNTTLYASDRDMFVFLCDEKHRITVPNRRDGKSGEMARGFFVWNSEVGSQTLGMATFLFDFVCANRIVWGATQYSEVRIRHTASAPDRWIEQAIPAIEHYANSSTATIQTAIAHAKAARIQDVDKFLVERFSKTRTAAIKAAHMADEQRPIETLWDAATAVTAYARGIAYQDERVDLERIGGKILDLAA